MSKTKSQVILYNVDRRSDQTAKQHRVKLCVWEKVTTLIFNHSLLNKLQGKGSCHNAGLTKDDTKETLMTLESFGRNSRKQNKNIRIIHSGVITFKIIKTKKELNGTDFT